MVSLQTKKIFDDGGVAGVLKEARNQAHFTLEKIEKLSLVQKKYLVALEEGRFWDLPSQVFAVQFFKAYCRCVGLNSSLLIEQFENEYKTCQNWQERSKKVKVVTTLKSPKLVIGPLFLRKASLVLMILAVSSYLGWQVNHIVESPKIVVDSPTDNLVTSKQSVDIKGKIEAESKLAINGQEVYTDKNGYFNEVVGLQPGINFITFSAKKKYSHEKVLIRKVMVKTDEKEISRNNFINNN